MSCCYSLLPFKRQFKYHHLYKASSQFCCFPSAFPWYHINDSNASICIFISNYFTGILISISLLLWRLALVMLHFYCTDVIYEETGEVIEWMGWLLIIWSPCSYKNKCFSSHVLMVAKHFSCYIRILQNPSFHPGERPLFVSWANVYEFWIRKGSKNPVPLEEKLTVQYDWAVLSYAYTQVVKDGLREPQPAKRSWIVKNEKKMSVN